jgi:hypothetical protein
LLSNSSSWSRNTRSIFLRVYLSLTLTLYFDSIAFATAAFAGSPEYFNVADSMVVGEGRELGAMFRVLTYRQRYEGLQKIVVRDALTNVYNRCRYGGEEFAILLPQTELAQATVLAERIVAELPRALATGWRGAETMKITVTIGAAEFPREASGGDELARIADRRLYAGKAAGRNRVAATDYPVLTAGVAVSS